MATDLLRRENDLDDEPPRSAGRRWRRRLVWFVVLVVGAALAAPSVVSLTPARNWVLNLASSRLNGSLRCGDASWGWFTNGALDDLEVLDAQGQVVAKCERVEIDRPLWQLAINRADLGTIRVVRPKLSVVAQPTTTNVEELLKPLFDRLRDRQRDKISLKVEIVEGNATIVDQVTTQQWELAELAGEVVVDPAAAARITAKTTGTIRGSTGNGRLGIDLTWPGAAASNSDAQAQLAVTTDRLPLAAVAAIVRRFDPQFHAAGLMSGNMTVRWSLDEVRQAFALSGNVNAEQLSLATAALGDDRLQLAKLSAPVELRWDGRLVDIRQCQITSDVGKLTIRGTAPLEAFDWANIAQAVAQASAEVSATLDVPKLAAALPRTLKVRPDTNLTGGQIQLSLSHREQQGRVITTGHAEVTQLSAVAAGRTIAWNEPLAVHFVASATPQGTTVEELKCTSSFLQAQASGTLRQAGGNLQFDLQRLTAELQKFFDLRDVQLAGRGAGKFDWQQDQEGGFGLYAQLDLSLFQLAAPGWKPWQEPAARVTLNATGLIDKRRLRAVYSAAAKIDAASDRLHVQLAKPMFDPTATTNWPLKALLRGDLAGWQTRLRPFVSWDGWEFGGVGEITTDFAYSAEPLQIGDLHFTAQPLRLRTAAATWQARRVVGKAQLMPTGAQTRGQIHAELENVQLISDGPPMATSAFAAGPAPATWQERLIKVDAQGAADQATGDWQLDQLAVSSEALSLNATGRVATMNGQRAVDLNGQLDYDLARLSQLLRPYVGENVQLAGRGPHRFSVRGPLSAAAIHTVSTAAPAMANAKAQSVSWAKDLTGEGSFGWTAARLYGLDLGAATIQARLARGIIDFTPLDVRVSEGRLTLAPQVRLDQNPAVFTLPQGPVLTEIRLTPQMCAAGLKYVDPFLAGAANIDGRVSLDIQGAAAPLADLRQMQTAGKLKIKSVQISPGPILTSVLPLLAVVAPRQAPLAPEVEFWVQNARVYHRGAGVQIGKAWLTTSGSVGFDESLDIVAEMPIPEEWLKTPALATALRNQKLRIPISGTLDKPRVDPRELDRIRRQVLGEAAGNLLIDQLDRALRPRPKQ